MTNTGTLMASSIFRGRGTLYGDTSGVRMEPGEHTGGRMKGTHIPDQIQVLHSQRSTSGGVALRPEPNQLSGGRLRKKDERSVS